MPRWDVKPGDRVGLVRDSDDDKVYMHGWGTYEGKEIPPPGAVWYMNRDCNTLKREDDKMVLDDGTVMWGSQVYWGSEADILAEIDDREIVIVAFDEYYDEDQRYDNGFYID